jgi:uncharacterized protein YndB with AHSA1/START domain
LQIETEAAFGIANTKKRDMADIFHSFPIKATPDKVFAGITTAEGLNEWWTLTCEESPKAGGIYTLGFGPQYQWKAVVTKLEPSTEFELQFTESDDDWLNTIVGFSLRPKGQETDVEFYHTGWKKNNEHYRISSFCWAMYLRILKRFIEYRERVDYEKRLQV